MIFMFCLPRFDKTSAHVKIQKLRRVSFGQLIGPQGQQMPMLHLPRDRLAFKHQPLWVVQF